MEKYIKEYVEKILRFGRGQCQLAKNSELGKIWKNQFSGLKLAEKIRCGSRQLVGLVLVAGTTGGAVQLGVEAVRKYQAKHYKPQLIDVPESFDDDGSVLDLSRCPEAFQPGEPGYDTGVVSQSVKKSLKKKNASEAKKTAVKKVTTKEVTGREIIRKQNVKGIFIDKQEVWKRAQRNGVAAKVFEQNWKTFCQARKLALPLVLFFENVSDAPYDDGGGIATIAGGIIRYPNGKRVTFGDKKVSQTLSPELVSEHGSYHQATLAKIRYYTENHNDKEVFAPILANIKVNVAASEMAAMASLVFNRGQGTFLKSNLLQRLNAGDKNYIDELLSFNYDSDGLWREGFQVRRGVEYLVAKQKINAAEVLNFQVAGCYGKDNLKLLYHGKKLKKEKGAVNYPRTDKETLKIFIARQTGKGKKVSEQIDLKTVSQLRQQINLASR